MTVPEACPGCRLLLPPHDGPVHPYIGASAACWTLYGEVLAREYGDPALMGRTHRASVDAYAAQHPGVPGRRSIQSVWAHLAGLHLVLERRLPETTARRVLKLVADSSADLRWLDPPADPGAITVADIVAADGSIAHDDRVMRWADAVWSSWATHHDAVRNRVATLLS